MDDDGLVVNMDGELRDITAEIDLKKAPPNRDEVIDGIKAIIILFDLQGNLLDINKRG